MKSKKTLFLLIFILILIIGLIAMFSVKAYNKYTKWDIHKDYFEQDESIHKIEEWMSIRLIENKFDTNIEKELNLDLTFYEKRKSIRTICTEENLEYKETIEQLNEQIKINKKE